MYITLLNFTVTLSALTAIAAFAGVNNHAFRRCEKHTLLLSVLVWHLLLQLHAIVKRHGLQPVHTGNDV